MNERKQGSNISESLGELAFGKLTNSSLRAIHFEYQEKLAETLPVRVYFQQEI